MTTPIAPPRFRDHSLVGFIPVTASQVKAHDAATRLVAGEIRNLVLVGPPGVGKTHLAAGIVNAVRARDEAAYDLAMRVIPNRVPRPPDYPAWTNVADAVVNLRLEMNAPMDDRPSTLNLLRLRAERGLVVLDDLGREKVTDWTGELVYALVNARYEAELPTIVTSNLTPTELQAGPYWACVSRLAEDGELIRVDAPDRRLAK